MLLKWKMELAQLRKFGRFVRIGMRVYPKLAW